MARTRYTVVFSHGDRPNQWVASVRELPECHTFGRGLEQTRGRIREALATWDGEEAAAAELIEILPLPSATRNAIEKLSQLRAQMRQLEQQAQHVRELAVASLRGTWSMRDIAQVLGVSHQRVSQIARTAGRRPRRVRGRGVASTARG
jgi:predicted RNase H-like HicB family nuclease